MQLGIASRPRSANPPFPSTALGALLYTAAMRILTVALSAPVCWSLGDRRRLSSLALAPKDRTVWLGALGGLLPFFMRRTAHIATGQLRLLACLRRVWRRVRRAVRTLACRVDAIKPDLATAVGAAICLLVVDMINFGPLAART